MTAQRPGILFVCTGNICRSALAEVVLRSRLRGVELASAGTHALVGHGMPDEQHPIALARGAAAHDIAAHSAQQLNEPLVRNADLVLAMTGEHRRYAMTLVPGQLHRIFTALEFQRLAARLSDDEVQGLAARAGDRARPRLDAVITRIDQLRGAGDRDDDVIDPYRRPVDVYEASAAQLDPVLHQVERIVRLSAPDHHG